MKREFAIETIKAHEAALRALGVLRLDLFGSVARDEAGPHSDLDVIADIDYGDALGFYRTAKRRAIQEYLEQLTDTSVDVLSAPLRPHHKETSGALEDAVRVL